MTCPDPRPGSHGTASSLLLLGAPPSAFNPENLGEVAGPTLAGYAGLG